MDYFFIRDFDFTITNVLLAHRSRYEPERCYSAYAKGRKVSGLVYCLSGNALYSFDKVQVTLNPGELIFLPESAAYSVCCSGDIPFRHITVNFNIPADDLKLLVSPDFDEDADQMVITDALDIKASMERLLYLWEGKPHGYQVMAKSLVYELTYKYFVLLGKKNHSEEYHKIEPAKRLLDEQFTQNIPIAELADLCGFSETHFRRLFTKTFHCSPTEYRLNKRILLAKDFLLMGELSVSEIARAVGFEDANYFSRVFKAYTGMTPSEYSSCPTYLLPT